jgi:hypothetical protein
MRAHLVRSVYRRAVVRGPPWAIASTCVTARPRVLAPAINRASRRTFFNFFGRPERRIKKPEYEPGYVEIQTWRNRLKQNHRPPPRDELVQSYQSFFVYKMSFNVTVNTTQARLGRDLTRYLLDDAEGEGGEGLTLLHLTAARDAMLKAPKENTDEHLLFSKLLYEEISRMREAKEDDPGSKEAEPDGATLADEDFRSYIVALTQYGGSSEAADLLSKYWDELLQTGRMYKSAKSLWILVLRGLAKEGREHELLRQVEAAEKAGVGYMPLFQEVLVTFYASRDRVKETKAWFEKPTSENRQPSNETYKQLLRFSVRNNQHAWIKDIFQALCDSNPPKPKWDIVFQWAVLSMGKGVEDIKHMIEVMVRRNQGRDDMLPDVDTINGLIQAAIEKNDPYLAERFLSLATELGIQPNATTFLLQIDYRINANDLAGANAAYEGLRKAEIHQDEDLPVINKYIRALCATKNPQYDRISDLCNDILEERLLTLEPETVTAICMSFLNNERKYDVIDILSTNVQQFSLQQRAIVRDALVRYCLDRSISTARVWDAYTIMRQYFLETPIEDRAQMMDAFFTRKRADMACHVFGHMRQLEDVSLRPTLDVYIRCFEGFGKRPDEESLIMIHNMLKLDTRIQPDTRLWTALMFAYTACERPLQALDYWKEITNSVEGPSYASIEVVFWACEKLPYANKTAKEIWSNLERMEVEIPQSVAVAYAGALAGTDIDDLTRFITGMPESLGYWPDSSL